MPKKETPDSTTPESWRDPSGWRPTPLQMSVPPERRGLAWEVWIKTQRLYDEAEMAQWIAKHGADAPRPEKVKAKGPTVHVKAEAGRLGSL